MYKGAILMFDMKDREKLANAIVKLCENHSNYVCTDNLALVMSLNASWGMGKTTFVKGLMELLKGNSKFKIFKFNVWENDLFDDPLCPFMYEIYKEFQDEEQAKQLVNKSIKIGKYLGKNWIIDIFKNLTKLDFNEIIKCIDEKQLDYLDDYREFLLAKDELNKFMYTLYEEDTVKIFIIDELDRCRPDYAVKVLETVKHFLNVKHYVFIFALDFRQLSESIKQQYGSGLDADGYLRRFFDINLNLPAPDVSTFYDTIYNAKEANYIDKNFIEKLTLKLGLSLRDLIIIVSNYKIVSINNSNMSGVRISNKFLFFLVSLKHKCPEDYQILLYKKIFLENGKYNWGGNFNDVDKYYEIPEIAEYISCFNNNLNTEQFSQMSEAGREIIVNSFGNELLDKAESLSKFIESKMELLDWIDVKN